MKIQVEDILDTVAKKAGSAEERIENAIETLERLGAEFVTQTAIATLPTGERFEICIPSKTVKPIR